MPEIAQYLLPWFDQHGRKNLPWQQDVDGYKVWLSEIMLQQTQVTTVISYFERFLESFPDVISLANADSDRVLQHWAGLGYYARARNLHKAAQMVRDEYQGLLPDDFDSLVLLPGIGRSTAGAILSLAFGKKAAILDGNVKRVLARVYQVEGWAGHSGPLKQLWSLAEEQTPEQRVAHYNQAMMDLGASLCSRSKPQCEVCPLNSICNSYQQGTQSEYPFSKPKRKRPSRHCWVLLHQSDNQLLLERRPPSGIWGGLWSLPELEDMQQLEDWQIRNLGLSQSVSSTDENLLLHRFSHFDLNISVACIDIAKQSKLQSLNKVAEQSEYQWIDKEQLSQYGLPAPIQKILQQMLT